MSPIAIIVCLIIALIIAAIATSSMRSELKSVEFKDNASHYTKEDSLKITDKNDRYLYNRISKREKTNNPG